MSEQQTGNSSQGQPVSPAWIRIERARHPQRPYPMDFIERIFTDFSEIHGDRAYGDDLAVACGMARLGDQEVMVIGNRKGGSTKERVKRNFGMPHPEGYRKALRCMKIAEKFGRPVVTFIDLPGAYPGLGAEERGQAEAIARNILEMSRLRVPTISVITGEGGSGGALALAVSDRVLILENALYFVITPESCAAIMWRDAAHKQLPPRRCAFLLRKWRRWVAWTRSSLSLRRARMPTVRRALACWARRLVSTLPN
jgi:acetyl-CoA carboxylase carboxyl transferase subunit alpha